MKKAKILLTLLFTYIIVSLLITTSNAADEEVFTPREQWNYILEKFEQYSVIQYLDEDLINEILPEEQLTNANSINGVIYATMGIGYKKGSNIVMGKYGCQYVFEDGTFDSTMFEVVRDAKSGDLCYIDGIWYIVSDENLWTYMPEDEEIIFIDRNSAKNGKTIRIKESALEEVNFGFKNKEQIDNYTKKLIYAQFFSKEQVKNIIYSLINSADIKKVNYGDKQKIKNILMNELKDENGKVLYKVITMGEKTTVSLIKQSSLFKKLEISVYDQNENLLKDTDIVGTSYKIVFTKNNKTVTYPIAVIGDVNSDGKVDSFDALTISYNKISKKGIKFDDIQNIAGQVSATTKIPSAIDALSIVKYRLGKIEIDYQKTRN